MWSCLCPLSWRLLKGDTSGLENTGSFPVSSPLGSVMSHRAKGRNGNRARCPQGSWGLSTPQVGAIKGAWLLCGGRGCKEGRLPGLALGKACGQLVLYPSRRGPVSTPLHSEVMEPLQGCSSLVHAHTRNQHGGGTPKPEP